MIPSILQYQIRSFRIVVVPFHDQISAEDHFSLIRDPCIDSRNDLSHGSVQMMERTVHCRTGRTFRGSVTVQDLDPPGPEFLYIHGIQRCSTANDILQISAEHLADGIVGQFSYIDTDLPDGVGTLHQSSERFLLAALPDLRPDLTMEEFHKKRNQEHGLRLEFLHVILHHFQALIDKDRLPMVKHHHDADDQSESMMERQYRKNISFQTE